MPNGKYKTHFAGKAVVDWDAETGIRDPQGLVYRIRDDSEVNFEVDFWQDTLSTLAQDPRSSQLFGLVIGKWAAEEVYETDPSQVIEALVKIQPHLPALRALFLGDIFFEECEISWIQQTDVAPLLNAYPALEYFGVRGGQNLRLGPVNHKSLRSLIVETGGLSGEAVRDVMASDLPALEHLELWLGTSDYGASWTLDDLASLFENRLFPRLRYLGLRDSEQANDLALAISRSPLLERIEVLDLSEGILDDVGAAALLANPVTGRLQKLDIHHHYCSETMVNQLKALPIELDASEPRLDPNADTDEQRYVAVSE
jgi:hypothetical protein